MIQITTYEECVQAISEYRSSEEKIIAAIDFMRQAISSEGSPKFRDFWRMKKICFELVTKETNLIKKAFFWKEYSALLKEAHRLQELFKLEIDFQIEQIQLAISGLEKEIQSSEKAKLILIPQLDRYSDLKELEQKVRFFGGLKEKVIALREEILGLEIRIHQKNELLELMKQLGDLIFPEYKKTVSELTERFTAKVQEQTKNQFGKKEIREFQALLKEVHISHDAYKSFREIFSKAWNALEAPEPKVARPVEKMGDIWFN